MPCLSGPPDVIPWDKRTRASPVEIRRAFTYLVTRHKRLAQAEARLKRIQMLPMQRHPDAITNAQASVENARAWLAFSADTLDSLVRFAAARIDGTLPCSSRRPRGRTNRRWHQTLRYYAAVLEEFKTAKCASAGHSASSDALIKLIRHSKSVVSFYVSRSKRESDDAEQEAMLGLLKAAEAFDPAHAKMARFNTYAQWKIRRAVEARTAAVLKPGTTYDAEGRHVWSRSVETQDDGDVHPDIFHPTTKDQSPGLSEDLRSALSILTEDERAIVQRRFVDYESVRHISLSMGIPQHRLAKRIVDIQARLQRVLVGHE